jgi:hypothetical protein
MRTSPPPLRRGRSGRSVARPARRGVWRRLSRAASGCHRRDELQAGKRISAKFRRKIRNIAVIGESRKNHILLKFFRRIWTTRPIAHQKTQDVHSGHATQNIPPTTPYQTLNLLISPQIDRNLEHYCVAQAHSTHHQHQLCRKFVTCYMLFF